MPTYTDSDALEQLKPYSPFYDYGTDEYYYNGAYQELNGFDKSEILNDMNNNGECSITDDTDIESVKTKLQILIATGESLVSDYVDYSGRSYYVKLETALENAQDTINEGSDDINVYYAAFNILEGFITAFREGIEAEMLDDEWRDIESTDGLDTEADGEYLNYDLTEDGDVIVTP